MPTKHFDVAVLGGGPAGTATALAVSRLGYSAIIVEGSEYEYTRTGETLPPAVRKLLSDLGIWPQFLAEGHLPSWGVRSAWGCRDLYDNDFIFNPYGAGWHLDRRRFDCLLARESERAGAKVCRRSRLLSSRTCPGGDWELEVATAGRVRKFRSTFLVDATGRSAALARSWGAKRFVVDHLIGVIGVFSPSVKSIVNSRFTLLEATEEGWWYSVGLSDGHAVAAYMTDADLYSRGTRATTGFWHAQLERTAHTVEGLRTFRHAGRLKVVAANSAVMDQSAGANWLAVGDAASALDPLSSLGIYKALEMGLYAAKAIHERVGGDEAALSRYALWVHARFDVYLRLRQHFYRSERRWEESIFWRRRHGERIGGSFPKQQRSGNRTLQ